MCGYALTAVEPTYNDAISAIDGNICRCTGYKSIERAAAKFTSALKNKDLNNPLEWLVENDFIPSYFTEIETRLSAIKTEVYASQGAIPIGGGTDLYVQKHDDMHAMDLEYLFDRSALNGIAFNGSNCTIKSAVTVTDLMQNETLLNAIPNWYQYMKLLSSTPIRNIATIAGNIANGSPIGDFTIILLALKAQLTLTNKNNVSRQLPLKDFYLGYKTLDKKSDEIISEITFELPNNGSQFHFEKVCKRQYLDIASVNTAITIKVENQTITDAHCAMGGVGPIPKYLAKTSEFLIGKAINVAIIQQAEQILQSELSPISDARGTESYKRLLARQLFFAHFITLFPDTITMENLI
jgi:xanthine dehydrogenase small subunit